MQFETDIYVAQFKKKPTTAIWLNLWLVATARHQAVIGYCKSWRHGNDLLTDANLFSFVFSMLGDVIPRCPALAAWAKCWHVWWSHPSQNLGFQWLKFPAAKLEVFRVPFLKGIVYNEFWYIHVNLWQKVRFTVDVCTTQEQYVFGMRGWRFSLASFGVLSLLTVAWIWPTWGHSVIWWGVP